MAELKLKFTDETGARREVEVTTDRFSIGRTPDNDLPIASNALSRKHAEIQRFANVFVISDAGSSNGTRLNGRELIEPVALQNNDQLSLGNAIELTVELSIESYSLNAAQNNSSQPANISTNTVPFWQNTFVITAVFGVAILLLTSILGFALLSDGTSGKPVTAKVDRELSDDPPPENNRRSSRNRNSAAENNEDDASNENSIKNSNENIDSEIVNTNSNQSRVSSEEEKIEGLALQFLRRISDNQNPVLNAKQIALINAKIKSLKSSAAFRENLRTASKDAQNFEKIGQTHNLKGAFLIAAALAKLNNARGDAAATATAMAPDLQKYSLVLGNELANDNLLALAAYAEGNPPNAMRDRVANLTLKPGATAATVRTVWFLHENGKLSEPAFDFAVRFIAAGTLLQNPAAFNL